jgi:hypothetical protein
MRPAKIVAIVFGVLLILIGLGVLAPGVVLLGINGAADSQGYLSTSAHALNSDGHALTTPDIKLHIGNGDWIPGNWSARIQATSTSDAPVFIGIGPTADVTAYLNGVAYDEVTNITWGSSGDVQYSNHAGTSSPAPPAQQTFWVAQQQGSGAQTVQWHIQAGDWTAVLMNADGSAPVAMSVKLGVHLGFLFPLGLGLTIGGVVLLAVGIFLVVIGARRSRRPAEPYGYQGAPPAGTQPPYGQPPYRQPPYGQQTQPSQPPYAPPPYGQHPYGQPPYGGQPQGAPQAPPPYQAPAPPPPVTPPEGGAPDGQPPGGS